MSELFTDVFFVVNNTSVGFWLWFLVLDRAPHPDCPMPTRTAGLNITPAGMCPINQIITVQVSTSFTSPSSIDRPSFFIWPHFIPLPPYLPFLHSLFPHLLVFADCGIDFSALRPVLQPGQRPKCPTLPFTPTPNTNTPWHIQAEQFCGSVWVSVKVSEVQRA